MKTPTRVTYIASESSEFPKTIYDARRKLMQVGPDNLISLCEKEVGGSLHITIWYWE